MQKSIGYLRMKIERRARWDNKFKPVNNLLIVLEDCLWKILGYKVILCLGDSHVKALRRLNFQQNDLKIKFRTISVMGATVTGCENLNSKTRARKIFDATIKHKKPEHDLAFMLGEIDTSYTIWAASQKKKIPATEVLDSCLDKYSRMLSEYKKYCDNLYVFSCPLPTVADGAATGDYLSERKPLGISKKEKTCLAVEFNKRLQQLCAEVGAQFIDITPESLDPDTGEVKESLLHSNPLNHHYDEAEFINLLKQKLNLIKL